MAWVALLCAAALAAMAGDVSAGFRYLDPVEVRVEEAAPAPLPLPHWDVHAGESLAQTLSRWSGRVGVEVHVLTDRRYRMDGGRRFVGSFDDAVAAFLESLAWLPEPPVAEYTTQGVLLIRHRSGSPASGRRDPSG
ncbi:MAG: TcpQ domain-containing protein [Alphaproteobacteria bacterium]|nr:TcpQ domain-containing protein [Alphaproteobacteria bacterium]